MKVAWLHDDPGYIGGAELTAAEFKAAAPEGVEVVDVPWDNFQTGFDVTVVNNHFQYHHADLERITGRVVRFYHDVRPQRVKPDLAIFCSPLQRDFMGLEGECVPPPIDLARYKPPRQSRKRREGACSIAQWRNPGKGARYVEEWAAQNGGVDVYGPGEFHPRGPNVNYFGPMGTQIVAQKLWEYESFVFLPFDQEPFGRTVAEAWAAGCKIVTNDLIGARHYIENDPEALTTAADDFWNLVLD